MAVTSAIIIAMAALTVQAQTKVDSISYGNNSTEWQIYETGGAVTALMPTGTEVWYATEAGVGVVTIKTGSKKLLSTLGSYTSEGMTAMARDKSGTIWIGGANGLASVQGATIKN
jgi:hypothetical protein